MKIDILIQLAVTNWNGGLDFSVKKIDEELIYRKTLKKCENIIKLFKNLGHDTEICFIMPDRKEERAYFEPVFKEMTHSYFFGDKNDVLNRILSCADKFGFKNIFRVNGAFWYLDEKLVEKLLVVFEDNKHDIVKLPGDFPHGFSGEFITINSLVKLRALMPDEVIVNPVSAIFNNSDFTTYDYIPPANIIEKTVVDNIRLKRLQYEPERAEYNEKSLFVPGSIYYKIYHRALDFISKNNVVLDIASGEGYGSEILATKAKFVYGGDYDIKTVQSSNEKYIKDNLNYILSDVTDLPFKNNYFDVLTSMETIEHVDEDLFIENVSRVLKSGGYLIITTPQNRYDFNLTPWHVKEYSIEEIRGLLKEKFSDIKILGCASGRIYENSEIGDRMMIIAKKK